MSATNRGGERHESDFYPTPAYATQLLLGNFDCFSDGVWLEPCAGSGAIIKAANDCGYRPYVSWLACEIDERHEADLRGIDNVISLQCPQDFLLTYRPFYAVEVVITNPPFTLAWEILEKSLEICDTVAMLLRLPYLGSIERTDLWKHYQPDIGVIVPRPFADATEYMWAVWHPRATGSWKILYAPSPGDSVRQSRLWAPQDEQLRIGG